jgi:hypothetical protein
MKKTIVLLISLFAISNALACSCKSVDFMQRFQTAKFIAKVKIISVYKDKTDTDYLTAKIEVIELFKGSKISTIKVRQNGCALFVSSNEVWLLFADDNIGKYLGVDECSGCSRIEKIGKNADELDIYFDRFVKRRLAMLEYLKVNKIQNSNPHNLGFGYISNDNYKSIKGYSLKQAFAIYEIEVSKNLSVKSITPIVSFDNTELSQKIMKRLKNLRVGKRDVKSIKQPTKLLLAFYYSPAENGKKSVVSISDEIWN